MIRYNMIVRDRLPEMLEKEGRKCQVRVVGNDEALHYLAERLRGQVDEFLRAPMPIDAADMLEIMRAIIVKAGWNYDEIEAMRIGKLEDRGGFETNTILLHTE